MEPGPRDIRDDVVNARGELTFAEQTRMFRGPVPGAERLEPLRCAFGNCLLNPDRCFRDDGCVYQRATPDDDPWYDVPPGPPALSTLWWQGVHPAHIDRFGVEPVRLPEAWYRR